MNPDSLFHPAVGGWFGKNFAAPTGAQEQAWPAIQSARDVLIAAPTGSGKTLAAFLAAINDLVRQGLAGELKDETQVVYVSPLKALSNDVQRNLEAPLKGISAELQLLGLPQIEIRTWVRTGDTPQSERDRMRRCPPHIVVTTPESLYILLGSESGRRMLATTRTVIVDEVHALAPNKRGTHLSLSLERLARLCARPPLRIGLSATQEPIEEVAKFLAGSRQIGDPRVAVIDMGHQRGRDLALEIPPSPLSAVMSAEVWDQVYDRLKQLIEAHRTTLVFVNTRRMVERVTGHLADRLGRENVGAHHGSLAKEQRFKAEQLLKAGKLKALVATASLELGIDIGDVDLVCQLGSPRAISTFLQRIGRSGHAVSGTPKGRLFPLSRDELVECSALLDSVARGELDRLSVPQNCLDVLAQQIVAEVAARDCTEDELFAIATAAYPYHTLTRTDFDAVLRMLATGFSTRNGRRGALLHHDTINKTVRARRGSRLTAITSGGAIPDNADYNVLLEPESLVIGSVNEDFAVESLAGDIFQLGNHSYRILRVERGTVRVEDAHDQPPTIPFWLGEAPGRSDELSRAVSRLREEIAGKLTADNTGEAASEWLSAKPGHSPAIARELSDYLGSGYRALGVLPAQDTIVLERFFDEAGGMQLVIHSPFGSRINRAWGLALRKRFCRKFNFELQAAASEDNIILSLTTAHSFELASVAHYLHSASVESLLIQALLDAPMFTTRWRWVAGISLAIPRFQGGKKLAPQLSRMRAEDLLGAVFPDQVACGENIVGDREIPDHPLVTQTIHDCLHDAMDIDGLKRVLAGIESGAIRIVACDLTEPSPLALEVLSARPYAYLDDAPLEERRTQAVMGRRWLDPDEAADIGRLDAEAIARVRAESWPEATNRDELHDGLSWLGFLSDEEVLAQPQWREWLELLAAENRVHRLTAPRRLWIAAERLPDFIALWPQLESRPPARPALERSAFVETSADQVCRCSPAEALGGGGPAEESLVEILRGRLEGLGPVTVAELARPLGIEPNAITAALSALESEGFALRGRFTGVAEEEWCERRLLARIHRYTINRLRAEIEPVAPRDFMRFLFSWQHVAAETRMEGPDALDAIVAQLEGFEIPAGAWESEILPSRLSEFEPSWLDDRCLAGQITWMRLSLPVRRAESRMAPIRTTPIALLPRRYAHLWKSLARGEAPMVSGAAQTVLEYISQQGACFFDELTEGCGLLRVQVENALAELVAAGLVVSDSFAGLRALLTPPGDRKPILSRARRRAAKYAIEEAGRWAIVRRADAPANNPDASEHVARTLLRRYGVVCWRLLAREAEWLPPWRDLVRVLRKLEGRGEIRGGRFIAGFSGEQFALPDAIPALRQIRRSEATGAIIVVSGADPLNLAGIVTPGAKLPAFSGNRALYRDGAPIAFLSGGEVEFFEALAPGDEWEARKLLRRAAAYAAPPPARLVASN
ncbi:MAG: DEAD/DEAH box helicase [Alphaproteobacteria bacterium]|nr:DEAD/DEAH box helicase [Alphaproteobacteria bacterium]